MPFTDLGTDILPGPGVVNSLYPHEYVANAYLAGITRGQTATSFAPYVGIKRAQLLTMIVRALQNLHPGVLTDPPTGYLGTLGDFSLDHGDNMQTAEYNGLLDGLVGFGTSWDPWKVATRGETAQVLYDVLALIGSAPSSNPTRAAPRCRAEAPASTNLEAPAARLPRAEDPTLVQSSRLLGMTKELDQQEEGNLMKKVVSFIFALVALFALASGLAACGGDEPAEDSGTTASSATTGPVVRVGSLLDSEGTLLGSMVIQMLEANGIKTEDKTKLGTPEVVRAALLGGEVDATIDYTGSGQFYHEGEEGDPKWKNADQAYAAITQLDKATNDIDWLTPAPANNSEFIATTRTLAEAESIKTMEDFAKYVNGGGEVKLIAAQGFVDNPLGLKGYEDAYGFTLTDDQIVALSTGNTAEMLSALARATDGINFSLAYGTDGQLTELDLVIITDTKDVPPVYEPAPVFRGEIIAAYPQIPSILEPLFLSLDQTKLQELNARIAFGGEDPRAVATSYLEANGFLE